MMQDMINGLLIVLIPMVLGYLLKVNNKSYIAKINHIVMFLLYIILFLMGYLLGQLDDLEHKTADYWHYCGDTICDHFGIQYDWFDAL